jgi:hypothetical protein
MDGPGSRTEVRTADAFTAAGGASVAAPMALRGLCQDREPRESRSAWIALGGLALAPGTIRLRTVWLSAQYTYIRST